MTSPSRIRLGLVGGIASGKSTVARLLQTEGWDLVDADAVAHQIYAPGTETVAQIREVFGPQVVLPDGSVDRKALGGIVFGDPALLKRLESLVHPAARDLIWRRVEDAYLRSGRVVLEMTLLYRWPEMIARLDRIVGVHCPDAIRLERLMVRNGLDRAQAQARLDSQVAQAEILAPAQLQLDNSLSVVELKAQLEKMRGSLIK